MPFIDVNQTRLHYRLDGPESAPVLLLSNSLGTTLAMWDRQIPQFARRFRVLRLDTRGHGQSTAPADPYTLDQLGGDVVGLLDALGMERVHFCGLSMGGLIGLWLAVQAPDRIDRLALCNTAARIGDADGWNSRIAGVRDQGMAVIAPGVLERWFTAEFRERHPDVVAAVQQQLLDTPARGYAGCCAAIRDADLRNELAVITAPTLVVAGGYDAATPPADGRFLAEHIDGARYVELDTAHLSNIEAAAAFTDRLLAFLGADQPVMDDAERYRQGIAVRRAVLGDAHVDRSLRRLSPFNEEFQNLISRYAWGEIWTRAGLPRQFRSLLTIGMMVALGREAELRLHLRAARNNGVTRDEIKEVLLQAAIYCGVPAANSAIHAAEAVFAEQDAADPT